MKWKPYPAYKPSGVEWLGDVPAHWEVAPLKRVADVRQGVTKGRDLGGLETVDVPYLRVANVQDGYLDLADVATIAVLPSEIPRFALAPGDVLMNEGGDNDKLGRGAVWRGTISPCLHQNHVFAVRPHEVRTSDWIARWGQGRAAKAYLFLAGNQTTNLASISSRSVREMPLCLPPLAEQRAIVEHLEGATAQIDVLLSKKRALIERLREKRTALISRAVTRGLPPEAARAAGLAPHPKLKPSGIPWLGDIPEHWELGKFSRELRISEGQVDPESDPFRSMLLVAPNHVESGTGRLLDRQTAEGQAAESGKYLCRSGDVIYSKIRPALAKATIAPEDCLCSADMYPMRGTGRLREPYLLWLLLTPEFTGWSVLEADRVAMPKINRETLGELRMPVPPLPEQRAIAEYLDRETARIDALIEKIEAAIERLQEYRQALITAAVTGKIDVRAAADANPASRPLEC